MRCLDKKNINSKSNVEEPASEIRVNTLQDQNSYVTPEKKNLQN